MSRRFVLALSLVCMVLAFSAVNTPVKADERRDTRPSIQYNNDRHYRNNHNDRYYRNNRHDRWDYRRDRYRWDSRWDRHYDHNRYYRYNHSHYYRPHYGYYRPYRSSAIIFYSAPLARPYPSTVIINQGAPLPATPVSAPYYTNNGTLCREYQSYVNVNGMAQQIYGTACLQPDGSWRTVN